MKPTLDNNLLISFHGYQVSVAPSWAAYAQEGHWAMVDEMLRALPGRRLTWIVDHGPEHPWLAGNEGSHGKGSWSIPRDPIEARDAARSARKERRSLPARLDWLAVKLAQLAAWLRSRKADQ